MNETSHTPHKQTNLHFYSILLNCIMLAGIVFSIMISFCSGLFFGLSSFDFLEPGVLDHLRNNLGLAVCSFVALFFCMISVFTLFKGIKQSRWTRMESLTFNLGLLLSLIYLMSGLQYLLFAEWMNPHTFYFYFIKTAITFCAIYVLLRMFEQALVERRQK